MNGRPRPLPAGPHVNLLDYLRGLGLTGAKEGCAEGECGACAVLVARPAADGDARRAGRPSTPAWCRRAWRWPARRSSRPRASGSPGAPAPGAARDGGARRLPVRLLHAGLRVQHGRRVLPRRPRRPSARRRGAGRTSTAPTASTCTPSRATCAAAPATARSATPPTPSDHRPPTTTSPARCAAPAPAPVATDVADGRGATCARRPWPTPSHCSPTDPEAVAGRRVHRPRRRGQPARARATGSWSRIDRLPELRELDVDRRRRRDRGGPDPHRGRASDWPAGSRCWTRWSRSSPPG